MAGEFAREFKREIAERIGESRARLRKCLDELSGEDVWRRPNGSSNSVGNLLLHLRGNITQWVLAGFGGADDRRRRDAEFSAREGGGKEELLAGLEGTLDAALALLAGAEDDELLRVRPVQGFQASGISIFVHVTEHLSYHTGQIAFWTKQLKDKDLGFYAGIDLNRRS
jgi:uncharacterized damage-inducible protein DinB